MPDSVKMLTMPGGMDATDATISANREFVRAVWAGIFTTTAHPAAKAGPRDRIVRMTGEFHGVITPTTPAGSGWE